MLVTHSRFCGLYLPRWDLTVKIFIYLAHRGFPEKEWRVKVASLLFDFYCLGHGQSGVASLVHVTWIFGVPSYPSSAFVLELPHNVQTRRIHVNSTVSHKRPRNPDISEASP